MKGVHDFYKILKIRRYVFLFNDVVSCSHISIFDSLNLFDLEIKTYLHEKEMQHKLKLKKHIVKWRWLYIHIDMMVVK